MRTSVTEMFDKYTYKRLTITFNILNYFNITIEYIHLQIYKFE